LQFFLGFFNDEVVPNDSRAMDDAIDAAKFSLNALD
jgi:hypothetical protein